jgi:ABC-type multidrug transport system fused ATPase/permease subunit
MPKGLDEMFGEGACRLSTGQKQRLAIARALLNDPQYLIFDEATSALDSLNDHLIRDAFNSCLLGRTSIFIAHRLSTIRNCHRIVVLRRGEIVQDGPFDQLSSEPGLFREMFEGSRF